MIYVSADDYGIFEDANRHILDCVKSKALNKVSVFPNFNAFDINQLNNEAEYALHLNFVEGKALSPHNKVSLLTDESGNFKHTFIGLLKLSIFKKREFEEQIYCEIKEQLIFWKNNFSHDKPLFIDSHQHTHMIPSIFKMLIKAIDEENIKLKYMRIPAEPIMPYVKATSLYFTYSPVNLIKQWLLKFLWLFNKKNFIKHKIPTAYFFGILFSGKMDKKRVEKVLPHYIKQADKNGVDIEILFHPGYLDNGEVKPNSAKFSDFYFSKNRKTEFDTLMNTNIL